MHAHSTPSSLALLALAALIAWRVVKRFRRNIGRQRCSTKRHGITLAIFPALTALIAWACREQALVEAVLLSGLAGGAALSLAGMRLTRLEVVRGVGFFYTPNLWLGLTLSLLFLGRMAWRLVEMTLAWQADQATPGMLGPVTAIIFGLLAGYNIGYAIQLLRWRATLLRKRRAANGQA